MTMRSVCILVAASSLIAAAALADEGGTEINHAAALVGIDATDPPGYPVEILQPGRYRLTGDLTPPSGTDGIYIAASDVSIDLNGHQIKGSGGGIGIGAPAGPAQLNVSIRGGSVSGMGTGIDLYETELASLRDLHLSGNGGPGFRVGHRAVVESVESSENQGCGGEARSSAAVSRSSFIANQGCGLRAGTASQLDRLVVNDNMMTGLELEGGGVGRGLQVARNGDVGISLTESSDFLPPPGPGPYPSRPTFELTDVSATANGGGSSGPGLRAQQVVAKIRNGTFAGNGLGIEAQDSDLALGSVVISENAGVGLSASGSHLRLDQVTVHGNGMAGGSGILVSGPGAGLSATGLVVYGHYDAGLEIFDADVSLRDFTLRDNGTGGGAPGLMFSGGPASVLNLRDGTLEDNGGAGLACSPAGTLRVLHGGLRVLDNVGGTISGCLATEIAPSFCDPPGGGPGSC